MNIPALDQLPIAEYAFPGPLRDALVAAIVSGSKTTTSSLLIEYELLQQSPTNYSRFEVVVNSKEQPVCITETIRQYLCPFGRITLEHAIGEGEGFSTVAEWANAHRSFWESAEFRDYIGDPTFTVNAETIVVCTEFRVVKRWEGNCER